MQEEMHREDQPRNRLRGGDVRRVQTALEWIVGDRPRRHQSTGQYGSVTQFDRTFWQREHDANSSAWIEAKRLCRRTVLANYPNCLPVNDIIQTEQRKRAEAGNKAAA